ncbi:PP2C family serine/threonine-protein phosphatase [Puniceibacterium sp. IMCC21224]|uniref:PP2C family serine/threonine-protein phosphatase n=1 Tax=Puniceibacterium sp. IMCC21224 TaxID=1618204 RepID=UPI0018CDE444
MIIGPGGIPKVGPANTRPDPERINLRNGRTRQPYVDVIQGYNDIVLRDDGGTGLTIALDGTVSGGPLPAGEYTMMLDALRFGQSVSLRARVSIIADPRDLWKNIPSDQNAALAKPDEAFDSQAADAVIIAASKRGRSHAQEGKYRDDHFRICANTETGWHILVVADGAGSAELSREGSRIACDTVMDVLPQLLADLVDPNLDSIVADFDTASEPSAWFQSTKALLYPVLPKAALHAAHAIEKQAAGHERPAQEFATTIVIAVSRQVADKWFTASFTVGDGGVAVFDAEAARVDVLCRPDSGEFAGQTRFLATSEFREAKDVLERLFVDLRHGFTVLAAMTDGITDPKFPTDALLAKADSWTAFWDDDLCPQVWLHPDNPNLKEEMLGWLDFWSRGNHDDRTIALMIPVPPEPPADAGETQATEVSVADQADDSGAADT